MSDPLANDPVSPRGLPLTDEAWDREYDAGDWEYLTSPEEAPRYGVITAYTRTFGLGARVLDLGCGEALLFPYLDSFIGDYTGLETSKVAIRRARVPPARGRVLHADIAEYPLADLGRFEIVIANEVLYHLRDPIELIQTVMRRLSPKGVLIISMFEPEPSSHWIPIIPAIWQGIADVAGDPMASSQVSDQSSGQAWRIGVYAAPS